VLFNIVTNSIFIPLYSFQAAAITTILSELILFLPFAWLIGRGLGQHLNWFGLLWRPIVAVTLMAICAAALLPFGVIVALAASSLIYLVVLALLKPLDEHERAILRPLLPARLQRVLSV
jgi:O-antigen/teichoic acid export membrane protein